MKEIPLLNRHGDKVSVALVDDQDFNWLSKWTWRLAKNRNKEYANRGKWDKQGRKTVTFCMHREIFGTNVGQIDHRDGNGLNNQRYNLRPSTHCENGYNRAKPKSGKTSRFKGVSFNPYTRCGHLRDKPWKAVIQANKIPTDLGFHSSEEEAAKAYDRAATVLHGEFARTNFQMEMRCS